MARLDLKSFNAVLIDSEKGSYNTSLNKIKERLTNKTKLIQLTHAGGEPVQDIKEIAIFAKKKKIFLFGLQAIQFRLEDTAAFHILK